MGDPLSICLGVITLLGAARKVCQGLSRIKHAPREIEELRTAADDLSSVLASVVGAIQSKRADGQQRFSMTLFQPALDSVTQLSEQLNTCLKDFTNDPAASPFRKGFDRVLWLKRRALIKDYVLRLVNVKASLVCALQAEHLTSHSRIEDKLDIVVNAQIAQVLPDLPDLPDVPDVPEDAALEAPMPLTLSKESTASSELVRSTSRLSALEKGLGDTIALKNGLYSDRCDCSCHRATRWQSPSCLMTIFGQVIVVQRPSKPCLRASCRKLCGINPVTSSMSWISPAMIPAQRMVALTIVSSPCMSPSVSLTFPRVVAGDAMIFHFATIGNIAGIKRLLEDGVASPDDIKCDSGFTALHYAVQSNRLETANFLVKARGNPNLHTAASKTAMDLAVAKVLTNAGGEETLNRFVEIFKVHDVIEDKRFSELHDIILGLSSEPLPDALDRDKTFLDSVDAQGRTPISWAAEMGDADAVGLLIDHLADVHLADAGGMTPLHYAATSRSIACLDLLLQARADVNARDKDRSWSALHYASFYQEDEAWVDHLLLYGADVHARTSNGNLPLILAIMKCFDKPARILVQRGADVHAGMNDGFSPLNSAIMSSNTPCLQVLLDAGIHLEGAGWNGQTTMHLVARFASQDLMECLMTANLSCLEPDERDDAGQTPDMLMKARGASAGVIKAYTLLRAKITHDTIERWRSTPSTGLNTPDEEHLFHDALERLADSLEKLEAVEMCST